MTKARYPQKSWPSENSALDDFSPPIPNLLLSIAEVAGLLGVCKRTVFLLLESGDLKRKKIRRRTMIHRDDVVRFAARASQ
jgi:excisionase family DNA binding protein